MKVDQAQNKGTLYLIPNVLSENTQDKVIAPQVRNILLQVDYLLVENVRTVRRYISSLKIDKAIDTFHFEIADKNLDMFRAKELMEPILNGKDGGIISEAGCPGIADPGSMLVLYAHQHHIKVVPVVGPSSIFLALMASGFNGQKFTFHGYLPIDKQQRVQQIKILEKQASTSGETQIFMETPYRNNQLFQDIINHCKNNTRLSVSKDLTGENEWVKTMTIAEWKKQVPDLNKQPCIYLIS